MFRGNGELIMVVDDEILIQKISKTILEKYGYRVITASDGVEAVAKFASRKDEIALVLTDMMMPNMDGQCTIRAIRRMNPVVKIIVSSGLANEGDIMLDDGLEVNAFIAKPCDEKKLVETVHSALHNNSKES